MMREVLTSWVQGSRLRGVDPVLLVHTLHPSGAPGGTWDTRKGVRVRTWHVRRKE
jgi:hypothetical protein